jgi:hypothetical protein
MCSAEVARLRAFQRQGVSPQFPARSRSGLRGEDGMVVFALPAAMVRRDEWGGCCPLWLPDCTHAAGSMDRAVGLEVLEHCRLAMRNGVAEGFLLYRDDASAEEHGVLALRVVKSKREYWAKWGCVARAELPQRHVSAACARLR